MDVLSVTVQELNELGRKLDAADLSDKEREVLARLFQIAAEALGGAEVAGFSFGVSPGGPVSLGGLFDNSFTSGPLATEGQGQGPGPGQLLRIDPY